MTDGAERRTRLVREIRMRDESCGGRESDARRWYRRPARYRSLRVHAYAADAESRSPPRERWAMVASSDDAASLRLEPGREDLRKGHIDKVSHGVAKHDNDGGTAQGSREDPCLRLACLSAFAPAPDLAHPGRHVDLVQHDVDYPWVRQHVLWRRTYQGVPREPMIAKDVSEPYGRICAAQNVRLLNEILHFGAPGYVLLVFEFWRLDRGKPERQKTEKAEQARALGETDAPHFA